MKMAQKLFHDLPKNGGYVPWISPLKLHKTKSG
jgi:hypothetical protein